MNPDPGAAPPRIGDYLVERELGRGGMGVVYLARDPALGRRVALKVLSRELAGEDSRRRFAVEAQAVARLTHPGIVALHQVGLDAQGNPFLVLDYVEGETLAARLRRTGPLSPEVAAGLTAELADALQHAHALGILHRDLKPDNVLLDAEGRPRLTDFGLARELSEERERLTRTGELLGTPSYMPPEQVENEPGRIGPATDVYALGALLYELLTGVPPFSGPSVVNVLNKILTAPPTPPGRVRAGVPPDLERCVLRALEKEPARRYPSAAAFASDLRRYLAGEAVSAGAGGRRWGWAALAVLAIALALTFAALRLRPPAEAASAPSPSSPAPLAASTPPSPTPRPPPTSPSPSPEPRRAGARIVVGPGPPKLVFPELTPHAPSREFPHLRARLDLEGRHRAAFCGGLVATARGRRRRVVRQGLLLRARDWGLAEGWDAPAMFRSFATNGPYLTRVATLGPKLVAVHLAHCAAAETRPKWLATWSCRLGQATVIAVGPLGRQVALGSRRGLVRVFRRGAQLLRLPSLPCRIAALAFGPRGQRLYVGLDAGAVQRPALLVWSLADPRRPVAQLEPRRQVSHVVVAPGGGVVIAVSPLGHVLHYARGARGGLTLQSELLRPFPDAGGRGIAPVSDLVFSPDGARLFAASRIRQQVAVWQADGSWEELERVDLDYRPTELSVSADGRHLLIAGIHPRRRPFTTLLEVWSRDPRD